MESNSGDAFLRQRIAERLNADPTRNSSPDGDTTDEPAPDAEQISKPASPFCIQNFLWLGVAVVVFYFSDFIRVMMYDTRIKSIWYWIGLALMSVHLGTAAFLVFWLGYWKTIKSDSWETQYPKAIPVATASFLVGILCLTVALWPVWGFLAPIILLTLFMGVVVVVAMIG